MAEDQSTDQAARLHAIAVEIAALAQNGLTYAHTRGDDRYELARYRRLQQLSAEVMGLVSDAEVAPLHHAIVAETGHATPKVDVRGALFDDADRILLVRERVDDKWTLPGGWADALDAPSEAVTREFAEEAGLKVGVVRLAAVHDGFRSNGHPRTPWHIYKLFFLVERLTDADPVAGLDGETTDVGFFALDDLPELSHRRTNADQLRDLLAHHRDPTLAASFD